MTHSKLVNHSDNPAPAAAASSGKPQERLAGQRLKVCIVSHAGGLAGGERSLLELLDLLSKLKVQSLVVLPYKGPLFRELRKRGISTVAVPFIWWMGSSSQITSHKIGRRLLGSSTASRAVRILLNLLTPFVIAGHVALRRCDIVLTNSLTVCAGAFAARLLRLPHIWNIREFGFEDYGLTFDLGERLSLRLVDQFSSSIVVNSQAVAAKFSPYFGDAKVRLIYGSVLVNRRNAESTRTFPGNNDKEVRCLLVGSIHKGKGQEDAVLATSELRNQGFSLELWIIGATLDQEYERYLRRLIKDRGLEACVKILGQVRDPFSFMLQTDVILMCSRHEARGRVTVEGMLAGKPVIGTRTGGTLDLLRDGFNGLLYSAGDYRELARKIRYLRENPSEAVRMGKNGREWAEGRFSQARFAEDIQTMLKEVLRHRTTEKSLKHGQYSASPIGPLGSSETHDVDSADFSW